MVNMQLHLVLISYICDLTIKDFTVHICSAVIKHSSNKVCSCSCVSLAMFLETGHVLSENSGPSLCSNSLFIASSFVPLAHLWSQESGVTVPSCCRSSAKYMLTESSDTVLLFAIFRYGER